MSLTPSPNEGQAVTAEASGEQPPVPVDMADEDPATSQLATDIARLTTMTHEQLLAERAQAEAADATGEEGDDDRAYLAALEKRLAELDQAPTAEQAAAAEESCDCSGDDSCYVCVPCDTCRDGEEECGCGGDDGFDCYSCDDTGWRIPEHCCGCGGSPYCVKCHTCGAVCFGDCKCPIDVQLEGGRTLTLT